MPADPIHPLQRAYREPYRPSPERDSKHLTEWAAGLTSGPQAQGLSPQGRRYLLALKEMSQEESHAFLVAWLLASGLSLPPFPDQE